MGFFTWNKHTDERPKANPQADDCDPAPLLGRVGDGDTIESGQRIAREMREFLARRHQQDVDAADQVSADPEMPIPNPDAGRPQR